MSKRAPDECTREGGKEKESKRKADKDKLHPLVPLSTWIRAEPVLAAADDIIVRSTTGEGGVSGIWSHPGNKCTCACPCKVQSDGFTTGQESSCDSNIQHRFISSHFLSLSCHPSVSTHFIILSFLDWLLSYCLQLHLCSLNSHFHAFLSFFPSSLTLFLSFFISSFPASPLHSNDFLYFLLCYPSIPLSFLLHFFTRLLLYSFSTPRFLHFPSFPCHFCLFVSNCNVIFCNSFSSSSPPPLLPSFPSSLLPTFSLALSPSSFLSSFLPVISLHFCADSITSGGLSS